jgi:hypothetical protein
MSKFKNKRRRGSPGQVSQVGQVSHDDQAGRADEARQAMIEAHPELAGKLEQLSPEEMDMFLGLIQKALKKRRIQLAGYLLSLVCMIGGLLFALYVYGNREPGEFVGWAALVPFGLVAAVLLIFGRWSRSL